MSSKLEAVANAKTKRGSALILVFTILVALTGVTVLLINLGMAEQMSTNTLRNFSVSDAMAEAATEYAIKYTSKLVANFSPPNPTPNPGGVNDPVSTWPTVKVNGQDVSYAISPLMPAPYFKNKFDPVTQEYQNLYDYWISASVTYQENPGAPPATSKINQSVEFTGVPISGFFAYYGDPGNDLEMLPGADAIWSGKVYSMHDIYVGVQPGSTLYFNSNYFRSAGNVYRKRKDKVDYMEGDVYIKTLDNAYSSGLDSSGNPIAAQFKKMESRGQLNTAGVPYASTTPTTAAPNVQGFDSSFIGYDKNQNGSFTDAPDYKPFTQRANDLWAPTGSNSTGTVVTGASGLAPSFTPDYKQFQALNDTGATTGGDYNWDNTNKRYQKVASGTGRFKKGYYADGANFAKNQADPTQGSGLTHYTVYSQKDYSTGTVTPKMFKYDPGTNTNIDITSSLPAGTLTEKSLWDAREARTTSVTEVDVGKLGTDSRFRFYNGDSNPSNNNIGSVIYMYRDDSVGDTLPNATVPGATVANSSLVSNGFRIANASALPNNISWVSEDPVYLKGDYNTGYSRPFSATNDSPAGGVAPVDSATGVPYTAWSETDFNTYNGGLYSSIQKKKYSSALMADAINLLSNAWNDSKTSSSGIPVPATTMVNTAMMSGTVKTNGSTYSGGLENFIRFHEDWGKDNGRWVKVRGSFENLYQSHFAKKAWGSGTNVYNPPKRNWNWETDFKNYDKTPPGMPFSVGQKRVAWWQA